MIYTVNKKTNKIKYIRHNDTIRVSGDSRNSPKFLDPSWAAQRRPSLRRLVRRLLASGAKCISIQHVMVMIYEGRFGVS